jgi:taurine dioxygenase
MALSSPRSEPLPSLASPEVGFERAGAHLGAYVSGVDLAQPLAPRVVQALRGGLRDYGVLFFRDQRLDVASFLGAVKWFGHPRRHNPYLPHAGAEGAVEEVVSEGGRRLANETFHADVTWRPNPPRLTALYAVELPPLGGDTVWTSATAAYRSLHPLLGAYLETLTAVNYVDASGHARSGLGDDAERDFAELREKHPPIRVPVVATHAETGEKAFFVSELHTAYIEGLTRSASDSLLRLIFGALENPELHVRLSWRPGTFAVWDNRKTQHRALHDYGALRRQLYRVTLD